MTFSMDHCSYFLIGLPTTILSFCSFIWWPDWFLKNIHILPDQCQGCILQWIKVLVVHYFLRPVYIEEGRAVFSKCQWLTGDRKKRGSSTLMNMFEMTEFLTCVRVGGWCGAAEEKDWSWGLKMKKVRWKEHEVKVGKRIEKNKIGIITSASIELGSNRIFTLMWRKLLYKCQKCL